LSADDAEGGNALCVDPAKLAIRTLMILIDARARIMISMT